MEEISLARMRRSQGAHCPEGGSKKRAMEWERSFAGKEEPEGMDRGFAGKEESEGMDRGPMRRDNYGIRRRL